MFLRNSREISNISKEMYVGEPHCRKIERQLEDSLSFRLLKFSFFFVAFFLLNSETHRSSKQGECACHILAENVRS
jgi:hypothetical protein